jgi:hypothetical protein
MSTYRALLHYQPDAYPVPAILDDLRRCVAESGWADGHLAVLPLQDSRVWLIRFHEGQLRLTAEQAVALHTAVASGEVRDVFVKGWPATAHPPHACVAPWVRAFTRTLPATDQDVLPGKAG